MSRPVIAPTAGLVLGLLGSAPLLAQLPMVPELPLGCLVAEVEQLGRNPTPDEIRCRYGMNGPGRFGLSFSDLPVYQTVNPLPGTHLVGLEGFPAPAPGESYEEWEWRMLRTEFGHGEQRVRREVELLHPSMIPRIVWLEARLRAEGIAFRRMETWRSAERQAYLFQQGRSRPGPFATTTLTSWHNGVDASGGTAGRAVDYGGTAVTSRRFHELARQAGLASFGADSHDPGHVYMPASEVVPAVEVALLRILPRVPEVTLATGRPVDERRGSHQLAEFRRQARAFLEEPFFRAPTPRLAGNERPLPWFTEVVAGPRPALPDHPRPGLLSLLRPRRGVEAGPTAALQLEEGR